MHVVVAWVRFNMVWGCGVDLLNCRYCAGLFSMLLLDCMLVFVARFGFRAIMAICHSAKHNSAFLIWLEPSLEP